MVNPLGPIVSSPPARAPSRTATLVGTNVKLEPLTIAHTDDLWACIGGEQNAALFDYLPDEPFAEKQALETALASKQHDSTSVFFAVVRNDTALGWCALINISPANGDVEIGNLCYSPLLQRTMSATELVYLLLKHVFDDLGFRRCVWKCNALNAPSRRAAERLGFVYEGLFRKHLVVKGRNRDTAWYSMLDDEWELRKRAFGLWLADSNFDELGRQKRRLQDVGEEVMA